MKHITSPTVAIAIMFALLAAGSSALAATPVNPDAAASIGSPAGGFVIPAGATASFTNVEFGACNNLSWGYQLDAGPNVIQATFPGGCFSQTEPDVTVGPFTTSQVIRVFLSDLTCGQIYYSDGTPVDHVIVSGSNPYVLRFADAGGFCERLGPLTDFTGFNFTATLTISKGTDELLSDLLNRVQGLGPGNSLPAKIGAVQQSRANGNASAACGQLSAFINEVMAQSGKTLTEAEAAELIAAATQIEASMLCP